MPSTLSSTARSSSPDSSILFRHRRRPDWGVAMIAWESADKRGYQFDDGRLRVLKKGFYDLMERVEDGDVPEERMSVALEKNLAARSKPLKKVYPFEDQLKIFRSLFPKGFEGERWRERRRGVDGRRLKRHRDPALELAADKLGEAELKTFVEEDRAEEVVQRVAEVLETTDLVTSSEVQALSRLDVGVQKEFGKALVDLLYGDAAFSKRFRNWVEVQKAESSWAPSWRLSTAIPALVKPEKHVCVRPSTFRKQAAVFAPRKRYARKPGTISYENFLKVAERTRERLCSSGFAPKDLLDVHDFVLVTLRPSAARVLQDAAPG